MKDSKSLGRGLSSLITQNSSSSSGTGSESSGTGQDAYVSGSEKKETEQSSEETFCTVAIERIWPNPYQPRETFEENALRELATSIAQQGVLQPLVVTPAENEDEYVLIAGERRLRAAKEAGLQTVPVIIRERISQEDQAQLALIENLQRQNLDPMERARGIADLQKRFRLTQEQIAENLHISRSRIANSLRLLGLPPSVQAALSEGKITEGHAKIIAGLPDREAQEKLLQTILNQTLNVRDTESLVKTSPESYTKSVNTRVKHIAHQMSERLKSKVEIRPRQDRYVVTLNVSSEEDLESLANKLDV